MWNNQQKHRLKKTGGHVLLVAPQILLGPLLFITRKSLCILPE
jgi:hypothetical protein